MISKKDIYIFIGPPGSGKGSLSALCCRELGWTQLSTGNLCRKHIANQTEIGKEIDFAIKSGKLVSDSLISTMVTDWFTQGAGQKSAVILDGYPRTVVQAQELNFFLKEQLGLSSLHVVRLILPDDVIIARLGGRYICQNKDCQAVYSLIKGALLSPRSLDYCDYCNSQVGRRKDDEEDAVRERLKIYHCHEDALLGFYQAIGQKVLNISVKSSLEQVFKDFKQMVDLK